jgi:FkbM family methyltransferase
MREDLIFDFGMHNGLDTEWYLAKGFKVVAVEANPVLARQVAERLSTAIGDGRLIIENIGIAEVAGELPFYVNFDNDEWSSFDRNLGTREHTRFEVIPVPCLSAAALFARYGTPYYVKIDIEGADDLVVRSVAGLNEKPKYISAEDNGFTSLVEMHNAGCKSFKFMDQVEKWRIELPNPPREGRYAPGNFGAQTSGPFGEETPGNWLSLDEAALFYLTHIRPPGTGLKQHWWDIHAKFS